MNTLMQPFKKQKCKHNVCPCAKPQNDDLVKHGECCKSAPVDTNKGRNPESFRPIKRIEWLVVEKATVLHIYVRSIQAPSAKMISAKQEVEQAIDVYACLAQSAAIHGISIIEPRADSFVCVLDTEDSHCSSDPVGQLLSFAADLHRQLTSRSLHVHMGMASGATALVGTLPAVVGDAATIAEDMARLGAVAAVSVHESALWRWAATTSHAAPAAHDVECGGERRRRAATFELETGCFRAAAAVAAAAAAASAATAAAAAPKIAVSSPAPRSARLLRRSISFA
jgi:hypothetical protein